MKHTVKIIALLISIVMLLSQLVSCTYLYEYITKFQNNYSVVEEDDGIYVFEVVYPQISVSSLKFELEVIVIFCSLPVPISFADT